MGTEIKRFGVISIKFFKYFPLPSLWGRKTAILTIDFESFFYFRTQKEKCPDQPTFLVSQSRHFRLTNKYSVVNNLRASSTMFNENDFIILLTLSLAGDYAFPRPTFYIVFVG